MNRVLDIIQKDDHYDETKLFDVISDERFEEVKTGFQMIHKFLSKEPCIKFLTSKLTPTIFDENIRESVRNRAVEIGLILVQYVNITDLPPGQREAVLSTIESRYVVLIGELSESAYLNWDHLWIFLIKLCNKTIHGRVSLANKVLRTIEVAFRNSISVDHRLKAYKCWSEWILLCSLDPAVISNPRQLKILMTPMKAKFSRMPQIIEKRCETFVYLLEMLKGKATLCLNEFFEFCFGPFDDAKAREMRHVPSVFRMGTKVLILALGHHHLGTDCLDTNDTKVERLLKVTNFGTFYELVINATVEASSSINDWKTDPLPEKTQKATICCIFRSVCLLIAQSDSDLHKKALAYLETAMTSLHKKMNQQKFNEIVLGSFLEVLMDMKISPHLNRIVFEYCLDLIQRNSDLNTAKALDFIEEQLKSDENEWFLKTISRYFSPDAKCENILIFFEIWLRNDFEDAENPFEYLKWPIRNLDAFEKTTVECYSKWLKLYGNVCSTKEKKYQLIDEIDSLFNYNPFWSLNIIEFLHLMSDPNSKDQKFVLKFINLVASVTTVPILNVQRTELLTSIVLKHFESSLDFIQNADCDDLIEKLCQCLQNIVNFQKNDKIVAELIKNLKDCPPKILAKCAKSLLPILENLMLNEDARILNDVQKLIDLLETKDSDKNKQNEPVTSTRSMRMLNMANQNLPPNQNFAKMFEKSGENERKSRHSTHGATEKQHTHKNRLSMPARIFDDDKSDDGKISSPQKEEDKMEDQALSDNISHLSLNNSRCIVESMPVIDDCVEMHKPTLTIVSVTDDEIDVEKIENLPELRKSKRHSKNVANDDFITPLANKKALVRQAAYDKLLSDSDQSETPVVKEKSLKRRLSMKKRSSPKKETPEINKSKRKSSISPSIRYYLTVVKKDDVETQSPDIPNNNNTPEKHTVEERVKLSAKIDDLNSGKDKRKSSEKIDKSRNLEEFFTFDTPKVVATKAAGSGKKSCKETRKTSEEKSKKRESRKSDELDEKSPKNKESRQSASKIKHNDNESDNEAKINEAEGIVDNTASKKREKRKSSSKMKDIESADETEEVVGNEVPKKEKRRSWSKIIDNDTDSDDESKKSEESEENVPKKREKRKSSAKIQENETDSDYEMKKKEESEENMPKKMEKRKSSAKIQENETDSDYETKKKEEDKIVVTEEPKKKENRKSLSKIKRNEAESDPETKKNDEYEFVDEVPKKKEKRKSSSKTNQNESDSNSNQKSEIKPKKTEKNIEEEAPKSKETRKSLPKINYGKIGKTDKVSKNTSLIDKILESVVKNKEEVESNENSEETENDNSCNNIERKESIIDKPEEDDFKLQLSPVPQEIKPEIPIDGDDDKSKIERKATRSTGAVVDDVETPLLDEIKRKRGRPKTASKSPDSDAKKTPKKRTNILRRMGYMRRNRKRRSNSDLGHVTADSDTPLVSDISAPIPKDSEDVIESSQPMPTQSEPMFCATLVQMKDCSIQLEPLDVVLDDTVSVVIGDSDSILSKIKSPIKRRSPRINTDATVLADTESVVVTSPVTCDTPDRNMKLVASTLDISPIRNDGNEAETPVMHPNLKPSLRIARLMQMANPSASFHSPKWMPPSSPSRKLRKRKIANNDDGFEVLTFSREIPSPQIVPTSGILKRKMGQSDESVLPSPKRKRVNFSDPAISERRVFHRGYDELARELDEGASETPENIETTEKVVQLDDLDKLLESDLDKDEMLAVIKTLCDLKFKNLLWNCKKFVLLFEHVTKELKSDEILDAIMTYVDNANSHSDEVREQFLANLNVTLEKLESDDINEFLKRLVVVFNDKDLEEEINTLIDHDNGVFDKVVAYYETIKRSDESNDFLLKLMTFGSEHLPGTKPYLEKHMHILNQFVSKMDI